MITDGELFDRLEAERDNRDLRVIKLGEIVYNRYEQDGVWGYVEVAMKLQVGMFGGTINWWGSIYGPRSVSDEFSDFPDSQRT